MTYLTDSGRKSVGLTGCLESVVARAGRATTRVLQMSGRLVSWVRAHAVITGGLPLEEGSPGLGGHLRQQIRLVLEPVGYVEVALFAGRLEQENVLGRIVSPLRDFAVKRLGLVSSMPGHGHDSIGHVIGDDRAAN